MDEGTSGMAGEPGRLAGCGCRLEEVSPGGGCRRERCWAGEGSTRRGVKLFMARKTRAGGGRRDGLPAVGMGRGQLVVRLRGGVGMGAGAAQVADSKADLIRGRAGCVGRPPLLGKVEAHAAGSKPWDLMSILRRAGET